MIDWFTGSVGYDASHLVLGRFLEIDEDGVTVRDRDRWVKAVGSFEGGVQITKGSATLGMVASFNEFGFLCAPQVLQISGNPAKFLQGHNVTGPSVSQLGPVIQGLVRAFPERLRPRDAGSATLPAVHRSRVDVNTLIDLGSHQAVHDWLMLAEARTRSRHGRAVNSDGTVYWGQNSKRWAMKAYCKHCELQKHPPADADLYRELLDWTRTFLRIELVLRRKELKDRGTLDESIIWEFFAKLELNTMRVNTYSEAKSVLPTSMKLVLAGWYAGTDMKCLLPDRTFRRHRKEILAVTGIDVSRPYVEQGTEAAPVLLGMDELLKREVKEVPSRIQRSLFGAG